MKDLQKQTDEINAQVVNEHGDTAQVATEPVQPEISETTQFAPANQQEPMIPKSRFDEINARMKQAETNAALLQQQIEILARPQQQTQAPMTLREQVIKELGLENEAYLTVQQQIAIDNKIDAIRNQQVQHTTFMGTHQDYAEVVGSINPVTGRLIPSKYLQQAIQSDPNLMGLDQLAVNNPAFSILAYTVAKQAKQLSELQNASQVSQQTLQAVQNQQNILNRTSPMSPAALGGAPATSNTDVSKISEEEFQIYLQRVKNGEFDKT